MVSTIIVATDLSVRSDRALRRAAQLARQLQAELTLLHVLDDNLPESLRSAMAGQAEELLQASAKALCQGINFQIALVAGDPSVTVLEEVDRRQPDLLVVGPHRERHIFDLLQETTMQRIIRLTAQPVLLAQIPEVVAYDKVLAATDFSPAATASLRLAQQLAPQAVIRPVHALHVPYGAMGSAAGGSRESSILASYEQEARQADQRWRRHSDLPATLAPTEINSGAALSVLHQLVQGDGVPLLSVGAHGRVGTHRALLGSVANSLMRNAPCDLVICRP